MNERLRIVIAEHQRPVMAQGPERVIYHLPDGPDQGEAWFQPIKCGGGITMHGGREKVAQSLVCPDCLAGRVTLNV